MNDINDNTTPSVTTDLLDYAPGSTATITASGFIIGSTLEFQVQHVIDSGDDGVYGTADDVLGDNSGEGHESWTVTDGVWWVLDAGADGIEGTDDDVIGGDLDQSANGTIVTEWYVNPDDSAGEKFLITATGVEAGEDGAIGTADDLLTGQVAMAAFTDSNPPPVQTFYVPLPEAQMLQVLDARLTPSDPSPSTDPRDPMTTYIGIAAVANGTIIYYDHWEDGFEDDISNPLQATTEIWGDGNLANGAAPGVVGDIINAGTVIILNNTFATIGRDPATDIYFDGGDKFAVSKTVAVTRSTWADGSKTLMTDAVEVYDTNNWGTSYKVPVGQNIGTSDELFQYTGLAIMASEDDTVVTIDNDANPGTLPIVVTLDEGESYIVNGATNQVVYSNATIVATNPVQVDVLTGD
ncbi:MAG: IgGFc-binding protein, partial [Betaproteobacteria bacterium]|nr:IgGFc-binding protein [Betaproteobacteria bacterium]